MNPVQATGPAADDSEPIDVAPWPDPPDSAAYHGVLGVIARKIEPCAECDPLALLGHFVISFGDIIGRSAHVQIESTRHYMNEFGVFVGRSALGRKGTAGDWAKEVFARIDGPWAADRIQAGLSSGEGLISAVRDPVETRSPIRKDGKIVDYQMTVSDPGITDKRLLILETEFGGALRALEREGNKLSALVRLAWDSGNLKTLTKIPHKATDAHVSIAGHITAKELKGLMSEIDIVNGFANRFLWFAVRRQRSLPFGGMPPDLQAGCDSLGLAVEFAKNVGKIGWSEKARALWRTMYEELAVSTAGPFGEILSRCHPHVLRLAGIYTLADQLSVIEPCHLLAAKALWDASERCVRYIFRDTVGNPDAEKILNALKDAAPGGLTRTEIGHGIFQRHLPSAKIQAALALLLDQGVIREDREMTSGRPVHRYFVGSYATKATKAT